MHWRATKRREPQIPTLLHHFPRLISQPGPCPRWNSHLRMSMKARVCSIDGLLWIWCVVNWRLDNGRKRILIKEVSLGCRDWSLGTAEKHVRSCEMQFQVSCDLSTSLSKDAQWLTSNTINIVFILCFRLCGFWNMLNMVWWDARSAASTSREQKSSLIALFWLQRSDTNAVSIQTRESN